MGVGASRLTVPRAGLHVSVAYAINAADLALWARPRLVLGILFAPATFARGELYIRGWKGARNALPRPLGREFAKGSPQDPKGLGRCRRRGYEVTHTRLIIKAWCDVMTT